MRTNQRRKKKKKKKKKNSYLTQNTEMDGVEWVYLTQDRDQLRVIRLRVSRNGGNFLNS
jgi:hypothetical protein